MLGTWLEWIELMTHKKIIKRVKKPQEIKKVLQENVIMDKSKQISRGFDIPVLVIPVVPCSDEELSMVVSV